MIKKSNRVQSATEDN